MARKRKPEAMSLDALELAASVGVVVAVLSVVVGLGFGLHWMLDSASILRYGDVETVHPHLGLGFVTLVFGLFLAVVAWLVALGFRSQARPRRYAVQVALARQRAAEDL